MAKISNCLQIVNNMHQQDQDALLARLDTLQAQGMTAKEAQLQAAIDVLAQVEREGQIRKSADRQTETPEFKRWFGDSKVVDSNGKPLVVYHGTDERFFAFDTDGSGDGGAFFTDSRSFAENYGERVISAYLSIQNPYTIDGKDWRSSKVLSVEGARKAGHDGYVIENHKDDDGEIGTTYIAFKPTQIKSATGNNGEFNPNDPSILKSVDRPEFYSQLQRSIEGVPERLSTMAAPAWKQWLTGNAPKLGIKAEEIDWSGIKDYLDLQGKAKLSKQDLAAYLDDSGVRVSEVVLANVETGPELDKWLDKWTETHTGETADAIQNGQPWEYILKLAKREDHKDVVDRMDAKLDTPPPKYGQYTLPGGENYRELLLTLPDRKTSVFTPYDEWKKKQEAEGKSTSLMAYKQAKGRFFADDKRKNEYKSSHWDEANVLAHIRVNDRTDADGKRVLFVEEVQSDWGQDGKKRGFKQDVDRAGIESRMQAITARLREIAKSGVDENPEMQAEWNRLSDEKSKLTDSLVKANDGVAVAPFVTKTEGWLNLALKRIAMMAVEGGYDKVAFVNGEQSADRYDLSKQVDEIGYEPTDKGYYINVMANGSNIKHGDFTAAELEDIVGKEIVQKFEAREGNVVGNPKAPDYEDLKNVRTLKGEGLKVGGEGMIKFYGSAQDPFAPVGKDKNDKPIYAVLPQALRTLLPKLGGEKVGTVSINAPDRRPMGRGAMMLLDEDKRLDQPGFDVTDKMRETVGKGLPLFSRDREAPDTPEFKKWFGNSKVVDAQGKPLMVYHGSSEKGIEIFESEDGRFYFTDSKTVANGYGREQGKRKNAETYAVYLSMQKPDVYDMSGASWYDDGVGTEVYGYIMDAKDAGFDGVILENFVDGATERGAKPSTVYVVFEPTQIKSATGNNGQFDASNPDINKSPDRPYVTEDEIQSMYTKAWGEIKKDPQYIKLTQNVEAAEKASSDRMNKVFDRAVEILKSRPGFEKIASEYDDKTVRRLAQVFVDKADADVPPSSPSVQDALRAQQDYVDHYFKDVAKIPEPREFSDHANQQRAYYNSPSFQRWFKESKAVDAKGNPLVAFHVTSHDFVEFDTGAGSKSDKKTHAAYSGQLGSWFTAPSLYQDNYEPGNAEAAVEHFVENNDDGFKTGANTMPVHLSIKNPMEYSDFESMLEDRDSFSNIAAYKRNLEEQGYDGIVVRNSDTDGGVDRDDWVAFEPTQVKSAIGNNGQFDPTNPDIRKSADRLIEDIPNERWLQGKIDYAKSKGRNQWGVPFMGTVTGYFRSPVDVSVRVLSKLQGERDEQNHVREESLDYIRKHWDEVSKEPPYIEVAYNGEAWVSEGNHRIMVAKEKGLESLPVEIRYFDGGQLSNGPLSPGRIPSLENQDIFKSADRPWFDDLSNMKVTTSYNLGDLLKTSKKLSWWDRTIGTQYNLAQKHPQFKRVFDAVQRFIGDVSAYATRAADLAPTILPKLENWKDIGKSPLSAADVKALRDPIFGGTLNYTRDEEGNLIQADDVSTAGVVFTNEELRDKFGLNDRQIGLYREFRSAVNKSLSDLAVSDMLRYLGTDGEGVRERALNAGNLSSAMNAMTAHLDQLIQQQPERAKVLEDSKRAIKEKAGQAIGLMARGYAPLSRFGQYTVYAVGSDGEQLYFSMFENERDAQKMAREMREQYPDAEVSTGTMSQESYKLFSGVTPETLALFGESLGLEESGVDPKSEAFQQYLKMAKTNRSAMKRLIQRKGIDGFSEDAGRVLAGFVYSNARQVSTNLHAGEIGRSAAAVTDGDVKDAAIRLMEYVQNPREEAQALRGLMFTNFIGGSVASAMVNMTQPFTMTLPYLAQFAGITGSGKLMADAVKLASRGIRNDEDLKAALKRAEDGGVVSPQEVHQLMAQAQGRGSLQSGDGTKAGDAAAKVNNSLSKLGLAWGKVFSAAEQFNRRVTFIAAYKMAREQGMADPFAFAENAIGETQGIFNKGNKPAWARGAVGATLFTFKQYSIAYVEFLHRMWGNGPEGKKAVGLALAVLFLMSGMGGLPGADDLDDVIDGIAQRMLGKSFDSKQAKKEFFASLLGQTGAEFVMSGISGIPGMPIDVAGRMGLGNLIPGTGLLTKKRDYGRDYLEIAGPAGTMFTNFGTAIADVASGDIHKAAQVMAPVAAQNWIKAVDMATMGYYRDAKGRKVVDTDGWDALSKAIGFQPRAVAQIQDATSTQQNLITQNNLMKTEISDKWAAGRIERDPAKIEDAKRMLADWNRKNPDSPIQIDPSAVNHRVQEANKTKAQRIAATAPKQIRSAVKKSLEADLAD